MGSKYTVDVTRLVELWHDTDYTRAEIARELGLTDKQLESSASRNGLGRRGCCHRAFSMEEPPTDEDEASAAGLAFSPWVAARIKELGLGMPA